MFRIQIKIKRFNQFVIDHLISIIHKKTDTSIVPRKGRMPSPLTTAPRAASYDSHFTNGKVM